MCLAVPCRVIAIDGIGATVEAYGEQRSVNLMMIADETSVGDYVLIRAGGLAFERIEAERAEETLALIRQISQPGEADILAW
jgi:hydrogenase expression/formation protein HypC